MAKKYFTDESLATFVDEVKNYTDETITDLGVITIDIEGATEGTPSGINADTFAGYTIDSFVMYNIGDGSGEEVEQVLDADTLGGILAEDYATKQYVDNATGKELLWQNASPTSGFVGQNIRIDLSKDGLYLMKLRVYASNVHVITVMFEKLDKHIATISRPAKSPYMYDIIERIFEVYEDYIYFDNVKAINAQNQTPTQSNEYLIPVSIERLKVY